MEGVRVLPRGLAMEARELHHSAAIATSLIRDHKLATPFLLLDEEKISSALLFFETHLPQVNLFYAVKANPTAHLVRYFFNRGLSLDVSSAGEIALAKELGIPGERLFLSTPIKTPTTLEAMFQHRVAHCSVDTAGELERIADYREQKEYAHRPSVFIRIRIESKNVEVDLNTKFGCTLGEALNVIERAVQLNFDIGGICFHVGTQCTNPDNYFLGIETAMLIAKEAHRRFSISVPVINIGGGFCDAMAARDAGVDLPLFYAAIGKACKEAIDAGFTIYAEPGRCLVSAAGTAVTTVVGTNSRNEQPWAYLDDGIYGCFSLKLYEKHKIEFYDIGHNRRARVIKSRTVRGSWTVAGPTCDSLDVVAQGVELPVNLTAGDVLLSPNLGAYSISTACTFNGYSVPQCHLVRGVMRSGKMSTSLLTGVPESDSKVAANS